MALLFYHLVPLIEFRGLRGRASMKTFILLLSKTSIYYYKLLLEFPLQTKTKFEGDDLFW